MHPHLSSTRLTLQTFVFRPTLDPATPFEVLRWFRDDDEFASLNSVAWTLDPKTKEPLLCVAAETPKHIKILSVKSGEVVRTLPGHGQYINDLVFSPLSTNILASCSGDHTIRLWNLDPDYEKYPLAAIFHGEGHKQPILALVRTFNISALRFFS